MVDAMTNEHKNHLMQAAVDRIKCYAMHAGVSRSKGDGI